MTDNYNYIQLLLQPYPTISNFYSNFIQLYPTFTPTLSNYIYPIFTPTLFNFYSNLIQLYTTFTPTLSNYIQFLFQLYPIFTLANLFVSRSRATMQRLSLLFVSLSIEGKGLLALSSPSTVFNYFHEGENFL